MPVRGWEAMCFRLLRHMTAVLVEMRAGVRAHSGYSKRRQT